MFYKQLGFGLGLFSVALGAIELIAAKRIAAMLETEATGIIRAFGAREILAGVNLLTQPAVSTNVWNRVAGDAMDLAALTVAARTHPGNRAVRGSIAFVMAATALDILVVRDLARETGAMLPSRDRQPASA